VHRNSTFCFFIVSLLLRLPGGTIHQLQFMGSGQPWVGLRWNTIGPSLLIQQTPDWERVARFSSQPDG
jgi:hypothetical protein